VLLLFNGEEPGSTLKVELKDTEEVKEMLSLELIGVLGLVYAVLVGGLVKAHLARRKAQAGRPVEEGAAPAVGGNR
jgi:hypothetical protein